MAAGADGAVTSTHKFLSSLSQSSILNVRAGLVDPAQAATTVRMTQTTSPLLALLASLDACRQQLSTDGERLLGQAIELAADARRRLRLLPGLDVLGPDRLGLEAGRVDPLKLVVDVSGPRPGVPPRSRSRRCRRGRRSSRRAGPSRCGRPRA